MKMLPKILSDGRAGNFLLLFSAFVIGQGAVFLAQTHLVATNNAQLVGKFGLNYTIAALIYQLVDWGGVTIIARETIASESTKANWKASVYWNYTIARSIISFVIVICGVIALQYVNDEFTVGYWSWAIVGIVPSALNTNGLFDGANRSGISGWLAMLPALASGTVLFFCGHQAPALSGLFLGASYACASTISVFIQFAISMHHDQIWVRPRLKAHSITNYLREGAFLTIAWLPGQLFYRGQLATASYILGPAALGLIVYSKQIVNAMSQQVAFMRRAEFPLLLSLVKDRLIGGTSKAREILSVLWMSTAFGVIGSVMLFAAPMLGTLQALRPLRSALNIIAMFAPVLLSGTLYAAVMQLCVALGRYRLVALNGAATISLGIIVSVVLATIYGARGLAFAETAMQLVGAASLIYFLRRDSTPQRI